MPKAWSPCTGAGSNLGDRVLGEVEKESFIALPGRGGHSRGGFDEEFYNNGPRVGFLTRLGCVQGLRWLVS